MIAKFYGGPLDGKIEREPYTEPPNELVHGNVYLEGYKPKIKSIYKLTHFDNETAKYAFDYFKAS